MRQKLSEAEARKLVECGKSPRYRELERLQAYFEGTQYCGLRPYLDLASNTPRLERAPCVVYPLVKAAIDSNAAFAMGGSRFPRVLSMSSEDDTVFDDRFGLSTEESEVLDQLNAKLIDTCGLQSVFRQAFRMAQASKSVALIFCYRAGLPAFDAVWAKVCEPTFSPDDPNKVIKLEIRYRYIEYWQDALLTGGKWYPVVKEYRRIIDEKSDTTFKIKEIWDETDIEPSNSVDTKTKHGYDFCPVVWYARQRQSYAMGGFDGIALHEGKLNELDAINHSLSSRHLGAMYCGDPMLYAAGVEDNETLGGKGRQARVDQLPYQDEKTGWEPYMFGNSSGGGSALRKGPGEIWSNPNADAKLDYLVLPATALDAVDKHAQDLCAKVREALKYVWIDTDKLTGTGDISGKTLAFVFSSQLSAVEEDRVDFGRSCMLPALALVYRVLLATPRIETVYLPGAKKALPILQRFVVDLEDGQKTFICPHLHLRWGEFFELSDVDEATRVATAAQALMSNLITKVTAVEHVKDVFAIANVDQYADQLPDDPDPNEIANNGNGAPGANNQRTKVGSGASPANRNRPMAGGAKPRSAAR